MKPHDVGQHSEEHEIENARQSLTPSKSRSWWPHEWRHPNVTLFEGVLLTLMKLPPDGHLRSRHCENPVNLPVPLLHGQPFVCNKLHVFDDHSGQEPGSIVANP